MKTDTDYASSQEQVEQVETQTTPENHPENNEVAIQNETFAIDREALGENLPPNYYWSPGFIGTILALCLGNISNYLGYVLPANLLTFINKDIGPSANITWVTLAYTLGLSVGFLIFGRLSDIFGRRWFFIGGNGLAVIGSIIGATASNINALIGADVLLGLGGAIQISFTVAVSELVPNKVRGMVISALFFSSFEIACFGPVIGQALVANTAATWRWAYYLNIIVAAIAVICFYWFYHPPSFDMLHRNRSKMDQAKRQDFVGFVLFTGGLMLFLMGLSWGGVVYAWKSPHVIATIVVGFSTLVIFILWEAFVHKGDRLLPLHLFRSPGYLAMITTATVGSCVYYSMNVLWPQQILYLFPGTEIHSGWLACIIGSATLVGQMVGGPLSRYVKRSRFILIGGCISLLAFAAAMISIHPGQEAKGIALMFMACFSVGIIETCSFAFLPLGLPTEDIGSALGALGSIRSGGAAVATAIYTTILNNKLATFVPPAVTTAAVDAGLPSSSVALLLDGLTSGQFENIPGINDGIIVAAAAAKADAAANAFRYVWYAVIAFACVALAASVMTIDYGAYLTDDVARKMHGRSTQRKEVAQDVEGGREKSQSNPPKQFYNLFKFEDEVLLGSPPQFNVAGRALEDVLPALRDVLVLIPISPASPLAPPLCNSPTGHPHRRADYKIVWGGGGWKTDYGNWAQLPLTYGKYRRVTSASEKCPDLCTYVQIKFQNLKEVTLESHKDRLPDTEAWLWETPDEVELSTAQLACHETFGLVPNGKRALGLNMSKLVTTLMVPRAFRKDDALEAKAVVLVDSTLIPLVGLQQTLSDKCMADWAKITGATQGLVIEWGKGDWKTPWFINFYKNAMTFAIGWIPVIGPFLAAGWSIAFTAIADPDGFMDQLKVAIPSVELTMGLLEEFQKIGKQTSEVMDPNFQLLKPKPPPSGANNRGEVEPEPEPEPEPELEGKNQYILKKYDPNLPEDPYQQYERLRGVKSTPAWEAWSDRQFESLGLSKSELKEMDDNTARKAVEKAVVGLYYLAHGRVNVLPDDKYGVVEDYAKETKRKYMKEKE
ncbi:hypothetical protein FE257_001882 [Aspergillus nanangensis]|uniref:Major facilitator superfamily (MFS) profile domain-containing protein n=1 Tax=Aspergillus nanangensis TaxID=2582783 RepID=A0AAD4CD62_ASPNN|nr:hypothetical protein FE257_001882 [Aspergillus nanangensis]